MDVPITGVHLLFFILVFFYNWVPRPVSLLTNQSDCIPTRQGHPTKTKYYNWRYQHRAHDLMPTAAASRLSRKTKTITRVCHKLFLLYNSKKGKNKTEQSITKQKHRLIVFVNIIQHHVAKTGYKKRRAGLLRSWLQPTTYTYMASTQETPTLWKPSRVLSRLL